MLLVESARDGFLRLFYRLVPRAAVPGYFDSGDFRGPLLKVPLYALHD
jgi:hypothetical protein